FLMRQMFKSPAARAAIGGVTTAFDCRRWSVIITRSPISTRGGRFEFEKSELILADRGYSHLAGAAKMLDSGGGLLMRWHTTALPVQGWKGKPLDLLTRSCAVCPDTAPRNGRFSF